jgi:hypothetical protein
MVFTVLAPQQVIGLFAPDDMFFLRIELERTSHAHADIAKMAEGT